MFDDDDGREAAEPIVPAHVHLAPLWRRVVGLGIDELVVAAPVMAVFLLLGNRPDDALDGSKATWFAVAVTAFGLVYETLLVWRFGRTVGKLVTGTKVVHETDGGSVSFSSSLLRALVPAALGVVPTVGVLLSYGVYLLAFFDPRRQGLHDKAAGTLVGLTRLPAT